MSSSPGGKPVWLSGKLFAEALSSANVEKVLKEEISNRVVNSLSTDRCSPGTNTVPDRVDTCYNDLKLGLRIVDLDSNMYWVALHTGCTIYLLAQLISLIILSNGPQKMEMFIVSTLLAIDSLLILTHLSMYAYHSDNGNGLKIPKWVTYNFYMVLSLFVAVSMVGFSAVLVFLTGFKYSPFLPSLLAGASIVMGAPRENSKPIYWVVAIILLSVLPMLFYPFGEQSIAGANSTNATLHAFGGQKMAETQNVIGFIIPPLLVLVLRGLSAHEIKER
jgi:hypothetical protein